MSQNPNEGYYTNLLATNPQQYGGSSNPSTPSSQNSNSSAPYGHQLTPEAIYLNQQYAFQQGFTNQTQPQFEPPQFYNPSQVVKMMLIHLENAKTNFEQRFGSKSFLYAHVWEVLKNYPKWDAEDPIDITCLEDIFGPDKRPRPERDGGRKNRAINKQKSTDPSSAASSGGSQTSSFSGTLSEKYVQKADVQMAAYEARRQKELKTLEMEEMKFLMIDPDQTAPEKAAIIRRRQKQILRKYQFNNDDDED